jgi:hypothetical protein
MLTITVTTELRAHIALLERGVSIKAASLASPGRAVRREADPVSYVLVQHEPGVWLEARVEKQWRHQGRWRLSVYYYVEWLQHYRVYDAEQCRPARSADDVQDDDQRDAATGHVSDLPGRRAFWR